MQIKQRILAILALSLLAISAPSAFAEVKIAVVDVQGAILQSEEAKRLMQQIQGEFKSEEDEIRQIQSDAAAMLERLQKDAEVMSDAEKRRLQQQIESKNNDFVRSYNVKSKIVRKSCLQVLMPRFKKQSSLWLRARIMT